MKVANLLLATLFLFGTVAYADEDKTAEDEELIAEVIEENYEEEEGEYFDDVPSHPLTDLPEAADFVETSVIFPKYPAGSKLPIGETVTVLCGLVNDGDAPINVTNIQGSLNSPFDFNFYLMNYTARPYGMVLPGGSEATFEYRFQLHPDLDPVDYTVALTIFYEDDEEEYSTTFFNSTVALEESSDDFNLQYLGIVGTGLGIVGGLLYLVVGSRLSKPSSKKSVERGTRKTAQGSASEWIKQAAPVLRKRNSSTKKLA